MLQRLFRIAVRLDVELVEQPAGLEVDQGAFGRGAAAVDAEHDLGAGAGWPQECLAALAHALGHAASGGANERFSRLYCGDAVKLGDIENKVIVLFDRFEGRADGGDVLVVFRPDDGTRRSARFSRTRSLLNTPPVEIARWLVIAAEVPRSEHVDDIVSRHCSEQAREVVHAGGASFCLWIRSD